MLSFPQIDALVTIYSQILEQHLTNPRAKFNPAVQKFAGPLINAALYLHDKLAATFLPTVIKFHYVFNLRDLTNIFQVRSEREECRTSDNAIFQNAVNPIECNLIQSTPVSCIRV